MTYTEILQKLEAATGPDREIDCMIGYAVDLTVDGAAFRTVANAYKRDWPEIAWDCATRHHSLWAQGLPTYTASLDAVVALIESKLPGWGWQARGLTNGNKSGWAEALHPKRRAMDTAASGKSPTLALLTAAIRALADKEAAG